MTPDPRHTMPASLVEGLELVEVPSIPWPETPRLLSRGFHATPEEVVLDLPSLARWRIRAGGIEVALHDPDGWSRASSLGLSTPLAAWSILQGGISFAAVCAIAPGAETATLVCTRPGGGKSTLLAALVRRGWTFQSEEPCRIHLDRGGPLVRPGPASITLWTRALESCGVPLESVAIEPTQPHQGTWIPPGCSLASARIGTVVILDRKDARQGKIADPPTRLRGLDALRSLESAVFQPRLVQALDARKRLWEFCGRMVEEARIFQWNPSETMPVADLAATLEELQP